jgi:hypothetical protein
MKALDLEIMFIIGVGILFLVMSYGMGVMELITITLK